MADFRKNLLNAMAQVSSSNPRNQQRPIHKSVHENGSEKSKRGLSKRGLSPKGANWAQIKRLFRGNFCCLLAAVRCRGIGPSQPRKSPKKALKRLQAGPKRPDFCGRLFARFSLKIWGLPKPLFVGNGANTVSESTVSDTELSDFFGAH